MCPAVISPSLSTPRWMIWERNDLFASCFILLVLLHLILWLKIAMCQKDIFFIHGEIKRVAGLLSWWVWAEGTACLPVGLSALQWINSLNTFEWQILQVFLQFFFSWPLLLPGGDGVWLTERDPVLLLRHQVIKSLPHLLIRLYLASHLMHVYPFFFYLKMETIIVLISCRVVVSLKLLRSVKHLRAIRVFCFSTTGKNPATYSTANGVVSKVPVVFNWKLIRCAAAESSWHSQANVCWSAWHNFTLYSGNPSFCSSLFRRPSQIA